VTDPADNPNEYERAYRASVQRESRRLKAEAAENMPTFLRYVLGGAIGLGVVGLLVPSGGLWSNLGERLSMAALCAVGGAAGGLRLWMFRERD
jgi:hypothetical protein